MWFTMLTQNTNPTHFDRVYASQTEFGRILVNSCFTLALVTGQSDILRTALSRLAPGGRLVYSTCSLLPQENEQVVGRLLSEMPSLRAAAMPAAGALAPGGIERAVGVQLLPGAEAGTDGFYYACLEKTTAGT
jgi:16S rRNA (cytosine967-C5)-methyltransferase